jgi:adenosylhomocysteine nucleosidase
MNSLPVVILFALRRESMFFVRRCCQFKRQTAPCRAWHCRFENLSIEVIETGMGSAAMEEALAWRFQSQRPRPGHLLLAGFCGSFHPDLGTGALVPVGEIVDGQGQRFVTGEETGYRLLTSPVLVGTNEEKTRLREQFQADVVDMESAVAAPWCRHHGVAFHCLRAVSDDAMTSLSPALLDLLSMGRVSALKLTAALLRKPGLVFELVRLARNTRKAAQNLAVGIDSWLRRVIVGDRHEQQQATP